MNLRSLAVALTLCCGLAVAPAAVAAPVADPGIVVSVEPLPQNLWITGATADAYRVTYRTTDARGAEALSSGAIFLPPGTPPAGGWPVVSWAHGTVGLGDTCAPSRNPRSDRDIRYLSTWMQQGYAVVASDYAGLGTPGPMAYLHGRSTAANVTDMVLAARAVVPTLSEEWVVIGQSQGAGGAIQTARYATEDGGPTLDYRGAVATGTPANVEKLVRYVGPAAPPVPLPGALNAYVTYILAGFRTTHPELDVDSVLTATGQRYLALAETECLASMLVKTATVPIGSYFRKALTSIPGALAALVDYLAMPDTGFDRPFFMGHGLLDTDVPIVLTQPYVARLQKNGQPVTWKTYLTTHSGTMKASLPDTVPFVRDLIDD